MFRKPFSTASVNSNEVKGGIHAKLIH
jgi:hypothetical protein